MAAIKGQNLRVFIGSQCVAAATSCSVTLNNNLEDASTKDSPTGCDEYEVVGKSLSVTVESLVTNSDTLTPAGETSMDLLTAWSAGTAVTLKFAMTNGTNNRGDVTGFSISSSAYIESLTLNAPNKQNATLSASFKGTGAITVTVPSSSSSN